MRQNFCFDVNKTLESTSQVTLYVLTRPIERVVVPVSVPPEGHADVSPGAAGVRADEAESGVPRPGGEGLLQLGLDVRLIAELVRPVLDAVGYKGNNYRVGQKSVSYVGCVISPLRQEAESRNPGQTFLSSLYCLPRNGIQIK